MKLGIGCTVTNFATNSMKVSLLGMTPLRIVLVIIIPYIIYKYY